MFFFKMKHSIAELNFSDFFLMNQYTKTRGNTFKLIIQKSEKKFCHAFFVRLDVKHWNNLKSCKIKVRYMYSFKKTFKREGIW